MPSDAEIDALIERLSQFEGRDWETTACYNGLRLEAAAFLAALRDERDRLRKNCVPISYDLKYVFIDGFGLLPIDYSDGKAEARVRELEQKLERARVALEPFGQAANDAEEFAGHDGPLGQYIEFKQLRRARATLAEIGQRE